MINCCLEHVELALDIAVDEHEIAPKLEELSKEKQLSTTCEYCGNNAIYVVAN
ncbi:CxxH/CxxC protein [Rossellomorea marisflavi]|uniref:CxxH/CxxC protein n=1 Tax=Rossellomorea marisflavi TaxID=189381 RepID=UPI001EE2961A|nr:CxxH/CxxC protein [Rossellomorea marisflavi]UKS65327.1 CxxH/CxxC protein [Rossellomorea marisflavi]